MAQLSSPMETVDVRDCETHDMMDQIKQELENLKNENKLVNDQIDLDRSNGKYYRVLFVVNLLIICAGVVRYFTYDSPKEPNTILQNQPLNCQPLGADLTMVKLQIHKEMETQNKQELENLKKENKLVKDQINILKSNGKYYRVLFFVYLLIICAGVVKFLSSVSDNELHTILQDQRVQRVDAELDKVKLQIQKEKETLCKNIDELHTKLEDQTVQSQRLKADLDKVKLQIKKEKETLCKNIDEMRENQTTGLGNMEKRVQEIGKNVEKQNWAEFVWPINGWAEKIQSAKTGSIKTLFSEAFYSHKNGYKMRLSVWPDGFGEGTGTHLGVAFHLMQSEINNILTWPFKRPVILSIINQHTGIDHFSEICLYDNLPNHINWIKPTTDLNEGLGTNKLVPLTELSSNPELCQNDTIFIKCVVK